MIKRTNLVSKRPELGDSRFCELWLREHARHAKRLVGVREYVSDSVTVGPEDGVSALATLRLDSRQALEAAFSDITLIAGLKRTRDQFARAVQVVMVDREIVVPRIQSDER